MKLRKVLSIILAVCMVLSSVSLAYAGEVQVKDPEIVTVEETEAVDEKIEQATVSEESVTEEEKPEASPSEDDEIEVVKADIVLEATAKDGMKVTLEADNDTFEYSEGLALVVETVDEEVAEEASEDLEDETKDDNVAKRVTYDIKVMHDGEEIQPVEGKKVTVEFIMTDIPSGADAVNVYHHVEEDGKTVIDPIVEDAPINEDKKVADVDTVETLSIASTEDAVSADTEEADETIYDDGELIDDVTIAGETEGFSLYTVDFTYDDITVSIPGGSSKRLDDIVSTLGIKEDVMEAHAYADPENPEQITVGETESAVVVDGVTLFRVHKDDDEWYADAVNAFNTEHGLVVRTADKAEYVIKVTDETTHNNDDCITISSDKVFLLDATNDKTWTDKLYWSTDKSTWHEWDGGDILATQSGDTGSYNIYLYGTAGNEVISNNDSWRLTFPLGEGVVSCTGNIETLRGAAGNDPSATKMGAKCYGHMFENWGYLTTAPELPAISLAEHCYESMFSGCTGLMTTPELPATTLADYCYYLMFCHCERLTTAPVLPANKLTPCCYASMFSDCVQLSRVPSLLATELAAGCYWNMFITCPALEVKEDDPGEKGRFICTSDNTNWEVNNMFESTGGSFKGTPAAGKTYYFPAPDYTVTLDGNGATTTGTASIQATYGNEMPSATMPTRTGYVFNGYYNAVSGGVKYYNADGTSARNWDKGTDATLYAQWIKNDEPKSSGSSHSSSYTTGWYPSGNNWQYVKPDGSFAKNEWLQIEVNGVKQWYHFGNDTNMDTGWLKDTDGSWYYLSKEQGQNVGTMQTGWMTDPQDGHRYYLDPKTGKMATGWTEIDGKMYYFSEGAATESGWSQNESSDWVYSKRDSIPLGALIQ